MSHGLRGLHLYIHTLLTKALLMLHRYGSEYAEGYAFSKVIKQNRWSAGGIPTAGLVCAAQHLSLDSRSVIFVDNTWDSSFRLPKLLLATTRCEKTRAFRKCPVHARKNLLNQKDRGHSWPPTSYLSDRTFILSST